MIDQKFIDGQKKMIEKEIKRLEKELESYQKYHDLGSSNEDNAMEFEAFEENLALAKTTRNDLRELKSAFKRIEDGTYGICEKCKQPIEKGRLKAYPAAPYCVTHTVKK